MSKKSLVIALALVLTLGLATSVSAAALNLSVYPVGSLGVMNTIFSAMSSGGSGLATEIGWTLNDRVDLTGGFDYTSAGDYNNLSVSLGGRYYLRTKTESGVQPYAFANYAFSDDSDDDARISAGVAVYCPVQEDWGFVAKTGIVRTCPSSGDSMTDTFTAWGIRASL